MDGTGTARTAIVIGLDKLSSLQQSPYAFYYASLSRDAMEADVVFILGSGLGDLHLNLWIQQTRRCNPKLPLIYVGYWPKSSPSSPGFFSSVRFDPGDTESSLSHDLGIDLHNIPESAFDAVDGWTVDAHRTAAVWSEGFHAFLANPDALQRTMTEIGVPQNDAA